MASLAFWQQAGTVNFDRVSPAFLSQQALASSQHLSPATQHLGADWQQALSSSQHFMAFSQQPGFSSLLQHLESPVQQASF